MNEYAQETVQPNTSGTGESLKDLPATGADAGTWLLLALVLVMVGVLLVAVMRDRRRRESHVTITDVIGRGQ